jgi:threonine/homoserine/homoserine lactone efflux protein
VDWALLLRGLLIGFSIAAPVGPIGVLCIRRTLDGGFLAGLASGLGAASADAIYGSLAGFGLTTISQALIQHQTWLRLFGGLFLCYLGVRSWMRAPVAPEAEAQPLSRLGAYLSTFLLTLTNPVTILAFAAIFAGLGLAGSAAGYVAAVSLVLGVFAGSSLWWLTLSGVVGIVRARLTSRWLRLVNRVSGAIIAGFGVAALISLLG